MKKHIVIILIIFTNSCSNNQVISYNKNKPTIIPEFGIRQGFFYQETTIFIGRTAGHTGILWAIHDGNQLIDVYFDEQARPSYHTKKFANNFKRLNEYDNMMAKDNRGIGWFNGVRQAELDYLQAGNLAIDIDAVSQASNTPENAIIPMAKKIQTRIDHGEKTQTAIRIVEPFEDGTVGDLLIVYDQNKIVDFSYDELIPENTTNKNLMAYAGQSKRYSFDYKIPAPARYGFFFTVDQMREAVLAQNDLTAVQSVFEDKFYDQTILPKYNLLIQKLPQ
ncbi:MAG: hypothetical protein ACRC0X_07690 [Brevinema sp.]